MPVVTAPPHQPSPLTLIRRAEERDRASLEAIAARTWGGTDYLKNTIGDWLNDEVGEFFVLEVDGAPEQDRQIVGTGKLTRFADDEWWLEGLRVHPDFQGRGYGKLLHDYAVTRANAVGRGLLRLSTDEDNIAVHRMALQSGFGAVRRYLRYETAAYPHHMGAVEFRALSAGDVPSIRAFLSRSRHFENVQRSTLERRWRAHLITAERLRDWMAAGRVLGWQRGAGAGFLILGSASAIAPDQLEIIYADASSGGFAGMMRAVRGFAGHQGYTKLRYMLPDEADETVAIEQAGWRRPRDNSGRAVLYAKQLDRA